MHLRTLVPVLAAGLLCAADTVAEPILILDPAPETSADTVAIAPSPAPTVTRIPFTDLDVLQAIAEADRLHLAQRGEWLTLLHYAHGIRGHRSRIDDERFFLSPTGATDPQAELYATISALMLDEPRADTQSITDRFPARLEWISEQLNWDRSRLATPACVELEVAWAAITDRHVSLIFPDAYLGTPASMFGHTLLVLGGASKSPLLRQSINYGAQANDSNGIIYAYKGLFGKYRGVFQLEPFYAKVQSYLDLDQRDLWEYELNFTEPEVRRMALHIWELREIWSDYFFFDENCSYNLLFLMDAARPGLNLASQQGLWVIPIDTIRSAINAHLVSARSWRPSRATNVRYLQTLLSPEDLDLVLAISSGEIPADVAVADIDDPIRSSRILATTIENLRGQRGKKKIKLPLYQQQLHGALATRAKLGKISDPEAEPLPPSAPETGHDTMRVSLGGGATSASAFAELRIRPVVHSLLDRPDGYLPGSQVAFFDTILRYYDDTQRVELEELNALSLRSYGYRDALIQPLAWHFDLGYLQQPMGSDGQRLPQGRLQTGLGGAWRIGSGLVHLTADVDLRAGSLQPHYALGAGASTGCYIALGSFGVIHPYAGVLDYFAGDTTTRWNMGMDATWFLSRDWAVGGNMSRQAAWDWYETDFSLRIDYHF